MTRKTFEQVTTIGIDIGKNTFHVIGLDAAGAIVLRQKFSRGQVESRLANMEPCLIGMEACVGAHHVSRRLIALGHDARRLTRPPPRSQNANGYPMSIMPHHFKSHTFDPDQCGGIALVTIGNTTNPDVPTNAKEHGHAFHT